jgi:WD40 repeat protein
VTFSHDGTQLASASLDETIKVWDPSTGELRKTLTGHSGRINGVAFSHDGTQLASTSWDKTIKLWDPSTGDLRKTLTGHSGRINGVAFSHDGMQLASACQNGIIMLWDLSTGELRKSLWNDSSLVTAVAFSHDGTQLAYASQDKTIKLWDLSTGQLRKTLTGHSSPVTAVVSSIGWALSIFAAFTGRCLKTIHLTSHVTSLSYSTNSSYLNTDRGIVELVSAAGNMRHDTPMTGLLLSAKDQWIYGDKSRVVRLPWENALQSFDSYEDVVVVGCRNGALLRFKIDRLRLSSEIRPGKV